MRVGVIPPGVTKVIYGASRFLPVRSGNYYIDYYSVEFGGVTVKLCVQFILLKDSSFVIN